VAKIAQIKVHEEGQTAVGNVVRSGVCLMDMNERQIALSVLESLRGDLMYAHLNNGSRILDVADLRQYIYEEMGRIRTNALLLDGLHPNDSGGNGKAHP
jgi:hypothetical protein